LFDEHFFQELASSTDEFFQQSCEITLFAVYRRKIEVFCLVLRRTSSQEKAFRALPHEKFFTK